MEYVRSKIVTDIDKQAVEVLFATLELNKCIFRSIRLIELDINSKIENTKFNILSRINEV